MLFHLDLSVGSILPLERQVSTAVLVPLAVTVLVSVSLVRPTRGSQGAKDLLGPTYAGNNAAERALHYAVLLVAVPQLRHPERLNLEV